MNFFTRFAQTQALSHPLSQMIQLTSFVMEGVFERFPRLRVAFLEAGAGWVPFLMDRLDRSYEAWSGGPDREFSEWVKREPSEYALFPAPLLPGHHAPSPACRIPA